MEIIEQEAIDSIRGIDDDGCYVCGKKRHQLTPFEEGMFKGRKLGKTYRSSGIDYKLRGGYYRIFDKKGNKIGLYSIYRFFPSMGQNQEKDNKAQEEFRKEFGEEIFKEFEHSIYSDSGSVGSSRECKDCIGLDEWSYFFRRSGKQFEVTFRQCCEEEKIIYWSNLAIELEDHLRKEIPEGLAIVDIKEVICNGND